MLVLGTVIWLVGVGRVFLILGWAWGRAWLAAGSGGWWGMMSGMWRLGCFLLDLVAFGCGGCPFSVGIGFACGARLSGFLVFRLILFGTLAIVI